MKKLRSSYIRLAVLGLAIVVSFSFPLRFSCAETNSINNAVDAVSPSQEEKPGWLPIALQSIQQFHDQQQATLRAVEDVRTQADTTSKQNAELLEKSLRRIEELVLAQLESERQDIERNQRTTLVIASGCAVICLMGIVAFGWMLSRTVNRRLDQLTPVYFRHPYSPIEALPSGQNQAVVSDSAAQSSYHLENAVERLERRIRELEEVESSKPLHRLGHTSSDENASEEKSDSAQVDLLLGKGLALLNLEQAADAIECFNQLLEIDPDNANAYLKKGAAYEWLGQLDEAIDCYDRAISLDDSMTIAYLSKGGVFNRLERYGEALECYEQASRTQQKGGVS